MIENRKYAVDRFFVRRAQTAFKAPLRIAP